MSDIKVPDVEVKIELPIDDSTSNLKSKLEALKNDVQFLVELGKNQDDLNNKMKSEIVRLSKIVSKFPTNPSKPEGSSNDRRDLSVYVGNMSPQTTTVMMRNHFEMYGKVVDAFILRKHERSQNGFVYFSEASMARAALNGRSNVLDGRYVIVEKAHGRGRSYAGKENQAPPSSSEDTKFKAVKGSSKFNRFLPY